MSKKWKNLQDSIRQTQKGHCARCGVPEKGKNRLIIHHLDHSGQNRVATRHDTKENLIGLCRRCHNLVHGRIKLGVGFATVSTPAEQEFFFVCGLFYQYYQRWPKALSEILVAVQGPIKSIWENSRIDFLENCLKKLTEKHTKPKTSKRPAKTKT